LIDGGKHNEDNYIVSKILTTQNPYLAANLSKLAIKTYVDTKKTVATQLFLKDKKAIDVDNFLDKVGSKEYKSPTLNRDVFVMFPYRMFNILPTVQAFSNRNINTGAVYKNHFFYKGRVAKRGKYLFVKNIPIDLSKAIIKLGRNNVPIKEFDFVAYDRKGKLEVKQQRVRENGLNVIILKSYGEAIIVDDFYYNSSFIQMFVFEHYNHQLFEPVVLNPLMKVYKVK
jgi:dolichyl-diphosphooligosaccharide--protein glycosyltransferase/undecaprenyl-diphosphooligosaccharide--protein glycosyltransferase